MGTRRRLFDQYGRFTEEGLTLIRKIDEALEGVIEGTSLGEIDWADLKGVSRYCSSRWDIVITTMSLRCLVKDAQEKGLILD